MMFVDSPQSLEHSRERTSCVVARSVPHLRAVATLAQRTRTPRKFLQLVQLIATATSKKISAMCDFQKLKRMVA